MELHERVRSDEGVIAAERRHVAGREHDAGRVKVAEVRATEARAMVGVMWMASLRPGAWSTTWRGSLCQREGDACHGKVCGARRA